MRCLFIIICLCRSSHNEPLNATFCITSNSYYSILFITLKSLLFLLYSYVNPNTELPMECLSSWKFVTRTSSAINSSANVFAFFPLTKGSHKSFISIDFVLFILFIPFGKRFHFRLIYLTTLDLALFLSHHL